MGGLIKGVDEANSGGSHEVSCDTNSIGEIRLNPSELYPEMN